MIEQDLEVIDQIKQRPITKADVINATETLKNIEDPRTSVESFLADEAVSKNLRTWAEHLATRFHNNWFTLAKVIKKTSLKSPAQAGDVLALLILKGFVHREQSEEGIDKYKVCLQPEIKIKLIEDQIEALDLHKTNLVKEIIRLKAESSKGEK